MLRVVAEDRLHRLIEQGLVARLPETPSDRHQARRALLVEEPLAPDLGPQRRCALGDGVQRLGAGAAVADAVQEAEVIAPLEESAPAGGRSLCPLREPGNDPGRHPGQPGVATLELRQGLEQHRGRGCGALGTALGEAARGQRPVGRFGPAQLLEQSGVGVRRAAADRVAEARSGSRRQDARVLARLRPPRGPALGWQHTLEGRLDGRHVRGLAEALEDLHQSLGRGALDELGERRRVLDLAPPEVALGQRAQVAFDGAEGNGDGPPGAEVHLDVLELEVEVDDASHPLADDLDHSPGVVVEPTLGRLQKLERPAGGCDVVVLEDLGERRAARARGRQRPDEAPEKLRRGFAVGKAHQLAESEERVAVAAGGLERLGQELEQGAGEAAASGLPERPPDLEELGGRNRVPAEGLQPQLFDPIPARSSERLREVGTDHIGL